MRNRALFVVALVAVLAMPLLLVLRPGPDEVRVSAGDDVQAAIDAAPGGATIVLSPGAYEGPIKLDRSVSLRGEGATIAAPADTETVVTIASNGASVSGVRIEGGSTGLVVREVEGVSVEGVHVTGAEVHGIEIIDASARIHDVEVDGLVHPMAQGIEIRNSDGRPDTTVTSSRVTGGQEGIVTHVSEVVFKDNFVTGTTMRGIVVTEMSDGIVHNNLVEDAAGAAYYCGDMSRCEFENNVASSIEPGEHGTSTDGWGLVVTYHAVASTTGDRYEATAGDVLTSIGGHTRERSPLDPGSPLDIALPGVIALAASALLVVAGIALARLVLRRTRPIEERAGAAPVRLAVAAFVAGLAVQTFHMLEHALQVYRVRIDHIPSRGGIVGPSVDAEWVHLAYNLTLLALIVATAVVVTRYVAGSTSQWLFAASVVQGWHGIEHIAKVTQHVVTGHKVNPGVIGGYFDLVWFHFTINLAVYVLCLAAAMAWLATQRRLDARRAVVRRPAPA